jgi:hypothetical protein
VLFEGKGLTGETKWVKAIFSFDTKWGTEHHDEEIFELTHKNEKKYYNDIFKWIGTHYGHKIHTKGKVHLQLGWYTWDWNAPEIEDDTSEE